jgi:hypothetical protein
VSRAEQDERILISSKKHFLNLLWAIFPVGACLLIAVVVLMVCVVMMVNGIGVKELIALAILALVLGLCVVFIIAFLPTVRLFLYSVRPGSYYVLTPTVLQRYAADDRLVAQLPFANMARVRLATARSGVDHESSYRVLSIELRDLEDRETILDPIFLAWSRKSQGHDIAMLETFFDEPLKSVYQKIKKRWRTSNKSGANADQDDDAALL